MAICNICNKSFNTERGLSYHISQSHKISLESYYLEYVCCAEQRATVGKCKVCGNKTPFISMLEGYQKTCGLICGGKYGSEQGHLTMLDKYGKKAITNPEKQKLFYQEHSKSKIMRAKKTVSKRLADNSYVSGGYKAKMTYNKRVNAFLLQNNCTEVTDLVSLYGQGWYKAKDKILTEQDFVWDDSVSKTTKYWIKNSAIPKIEAYIKENKFNQSPHGEKDIVNFVKSIYNGLILENSKKIITPYEIDIYIPEKKIAIEYNGTYWHSIQAGKDKNVHFIKSFLCEQLGIKLIHIYEYEWQNLSKRAVLQSILQNAISEISLQFKEQDCQIKEITKQEAQDFLNLNSLSGYIEADIHLGAFVQSELIEIMTLKNCFPSGVYDCISLARKIIVKLVVVY